MKPHEKVYLIFWGYDKNDPGELVEKIGFTSNQSAKKFLKNHIIKMYGESAWKNRVQEWSNQFRIDSPYGKRPSLYYKIEWAKVF